MTNGRASCACSTSQSTGLWLAFTSFTQKCGHFCWFFFLFNSFNFFLIYWNNGSIDAQYQFGISNRQFICCSKKKKIFFVQNACNVHFIFFEIKKCRICSFFCAVIHSFNILMPPNMRILREERDCVFIICSFFFLTSFNFFFSFWLKGSN